eukprot:TRINITY_DN2378_c0_g1_i4.p1 TRINITY_DN2378_c0_g1~~TRINITY_DN2378_c0_g1_i4.p1  ORF type:complete len:500 (+),score=98.07 TRINITY_DN2378_c0_g1_i4:99-1598(+)
MADAPEWQTPPAYNYADYQPEPAYPRMESIEQDIPGIMSASDTESQIKLVKNNFESLRKKLDQKEDYILESLKNKVSLSDPESENLVRQRESLFKTKQNLEESMKDPGLSSILADSHAKVTAQLDRIDKQVNIRKYLTWNISECENSIENVCSVCETQDILSVHRGKKEVRWEKVQPGSERTQVSKPVGLAVEPQTDRIYIADAGNERIQVFNSDGEHISHIPVDYSSYIIFICFIGKFLFSVENKGKELWILKMDPNTGKNLCKVISFQLKDFYTIHHRSPMFLLDLKRNDKSILTFCVYQNNHKIITQCYTIDNLKLVYNNKPIELRSPHIKDFTTALDVKIVGSSYSLTQFYVLYKITTASVQIFNWNGEVVKAIIQLTLGTGISSFLIDDENNIIISNVEKINHTNPEVGIQNLYTNYVFSNDGSRQHKWVYKSEIRGGILQSFLKPFNKKSAPVSSGAKTHDVTQNAFFAMCMNSKQNLLLLYNQEIPYMLRVF